MFGLGFWEIAAILVVGLLVLGPSKLPELARSLGKGLREFRKATDDFRATVDEEVRAPEPKKAVAAQSEVEAQVLADSTEEAEDTALAEAEAAKAAAEVAAATKAELTDVSPQDLTPSDVAPADLSPSDVSPKPTGESEKKDA